MSSQVNGVNGLNQANSAGNTKKTDAPKQEELKKAELNKKLAEALSGKGNKAQLQTLDSTDGLTISQKKQVEDKINELQQGSGTEQSAKKSGGFDLNG